MISVHNSLYYNASIHFRLYVEEKLGAKYVEKTNVPFEV